MESPITSSLKTLDDIERSNLRSLTSQSLISSKGAELGPMLLLNIKQESIYGEFNDTVTFGPEWPWKFKVEVTQILKHYYSERSSLRLYVTIVAFLAGGRGSRSRASMCRCGRLSLSRYTLHCLSIQVFWNCYDHITVISLDLFFTAVYLLYLCKIKSVICWWCYNCDIFFSFYT